MVSGENAGIRDKGYGRSQRGAAVRLVFCGTPAFAVPALEAVLAAGHEVAFVVTQPDRAAGRGLEMHVSPVKQTALARGIEVVQPDKIKNNPELRAKLEAIQPDAILVVAYGRIIPQWMLDLPRLGNINLHGSLLPKYRGAAPIQWAIAKGEQIAGVTTMVLEAGPGHWAAAARQVCAYRRRRDGGRPLRITRKHWGGVDGADAGGA